MSCDTCTPTDYAFDPANPPAGLPAGFDFDDTSLENLQVFYACFEPCCGSSIVAIDKTLLAQHCEGGLTTKPTLLKILQFNADPCSGVADRSCDICSDEQFVIRHVAQCCEINATAGSVVVKSYLCADPQTDVFDMTEADGCWTTEPIELPRGWYRVTIVLNDGTNSRVVAKRRIRIR